MLNLVGTRLFALTVLTSLPLQMMATASPIGPISQSPDSIPKYGSVGSSALEMLTDAQGIDFAPYLHTALLSVRQNWCAVIPSSVQNAQQGMNAIAEFRILQDGKIPEEFVKLTAPSGNQDFDKSILIALRASTPFSHLPEKFSPPFIAVRINFFYKPRTSGNKQGTVRLLPID